MAEALHKMARRFTGGTWAEAGQGRGRWMIHGGKQDAITFSWWWLTPQHVKALRAELAERFAPATANKWLAALEGVLKECWDLGLVDGETYQRVAAVKSVKGSRLLRGRALESAVAHHVLVQRGARFDVQRRGDCNRTEIAAPRV